MRRSIQGMPVLVFICYFLVHAVSSHHNVGKDCYNPSSGLRGICKLMQDCDAVISNDLAGINPQFCNPKTPGTYGDVCCPSEKRISEKKCEEYSNIIARSNDLCSFPFIFQNNPEKNLQKCTYESEKFIASGRDAQENEFPYMVALGYRNRSENVWGCGGTLISENFVLTAAQCISNDKLGSPRRALLGDIYLQERGDSESKRRVLDVESFVHPGYKLPLKYKDIALVKLKSKIEFTKSIRPACLPSPQEKLENETCVTLAGWGQLVTGKQSNILQAAPITRLNQSSCLEIYSNNKAGITYSLPEGIQKSQFCGGDEPRELCRGVGGGPLIVKVDRPNCKEYVLGVASLGTNLCRHGEPGVYTNVQSYLDWIEDIVWGSP